MDTPFDIDESLVENRMVYVRPVDAEDLPDDVREQIGDQTGLFAVHSPNGDRLAVARDRKLAFVLARQNDMTPVNVH